MARVIRPRTHRWISVVLWQLATFKVCVRCGCYSHIEEPEPPCLIRQPPEAHP